MGDEAFGAHQWNPADSLRTGRPPPLPSISTLIGSESGDPCRPVGGGPSGPVGGSPASFGNAAPLEVVVAVVGVVFPVVVAGWGGGRRKEEGQQSE